MNREIKFRYLYGIKDKPETYFTKAFTLNEIECGNAIDELMDSPLLRSYEILARDQYIDAQDRSGADIYEGDTLNICYSSGSGEHIHDGVYVCEVSPLSGVTFRFNKLMWESYGWNQYPLRMDISLSVGMLEVIGNIHQNPELLGDAGG